MYIILHMILLGNLNWQGCFKKLSVGKWALRKYLLIFLEFLYIPCTISNLKRSKNFTKLKNGHSPCLSYFSINLQDLPVVTKKMQMLYCCFSHILMIKKKNHSQQNVSTPHIIKSPFRIIFRLRSLSGIEQSLARKYKSKLFLSRQSTEHQP